ncbi:MAG: hypothetical protein MZV65_10910 [Chromatiales bacterium]|nr:hypothetical protein [Chromatiales bacterium]
MSGVNLDEEAANMLRFQQAYQAAAQVIATSNTMFEYPAQRGASLRRAPGGCKPMRVSTSQIFQSGLSAMQSAQSKLNKTGLQTGHEAGAS